MLPPVASVGERSRAQTSLLQCFKGWLGIYQSSQRSSPFLRPVKFQKRFGATGAQGKGKGSPRNIEISTVAGSVGESTGMKVVVRIEHLVLLTAT